MTDAVGTGHNGGLSNGRMLDQDAFKLEGTEPVIRGLEHIVRPTDVREIAVPVPTGDITGVIEAVSHGLRGLFFIVGIAGGQPDRARGHIETYLPLVSRSSVGIEQLNSVPHQGSSHRSSFHTLPG